MLYLSRKCLLNSSEISASYSSKRTLISQVTKLSKKICRQKWRHVSQTIWRQKHTHLQSAVQLKETDRRKGNWPWGNFSCVGSLLGGPVKKQLRALIILYVTTFYRFQIAFFSNVIFYYFQLFSSNQQTDTRL